MAAIYTPATIKVVLNFSVNGQPVANVLHVRTVGAVAVTPTDVQAAATTFSNWVVANLQNSQGTGIQLIDVTATDISGPGGAQFITQPGTPEYGQVASPSLPNNVAFVIKFTTGLSGRSYRGRFYFCGLTESQVGGNLINQADADNIVGAFNALPTALAAVDLEHVVVSTFTNGAPRAAGVATPITTYSYTDLVVDTQRKRLT